MGAFLVCPLGLLGPALAWMSILVCRGLSPLSPGGCLFLRLLALAGDMLSREKAFKLHCCAQGCQKEALWGISYT